MAGVFLNLIFLSFVMSESLLRKQCVFWGYKPNFELYALLKNK